MIKSHVFKSPTRIICLLTAVIALFIPNKASATNCDGETKTVTIPFTWVFASPTSTGTYISHTNNGPQGNEAMSSNRSATIGLSVQGNHNPPSTVCGGPNPALPTQAEVILGARYTYNYNKPQGSMLTFDADIPGLAPIISQVPPSNTQGSNLQASGETTINVEPSFEYDIDGIMTIQSTYFSENPPNQPITADARLSVSAVINNPFSEHNYQVPVVPEPTTIIGSLLTFSFIAKFKNRMR